MSNYSYVAVDAQGAEMRGMVEVADQSEAIRRIREMGLFPTRVKPAAPHKRAVPRAEPRTRFGQNRRWRFVWFGRVKTSVLAVFTRQLATLLEAGLPLLRGLRILEEQEENRTLKRILGEISLAIEAGDSLAEAMAAHPIVFNRLYVNMVKAGEAGGAVDVTLKRLAEFMEKAERIKGRVKTALFYPCSVLLVAVGILGLLMAFVVPRFRTTFDGLFQGAPLPAFTVFVFNLSQAVQRHLPMMLVGAAATGVSLALLVRTTWGRWLFDRVKVAMPVLGALWRKAAISRLARTLGTLLANGVPILQALTIVKETAGNVLYAGVMATLHDRVKEGEPMAPTLKECPLFPAMIAGMVDVGEQTGALPDMFLKIADTYEEQVDNAATGLTALLEPILILLLAVIVGSIVIAIFLPIIRATDFLDPGGGDGAVGRI